MTPTTKRSAHADSTAARHTRLATTEERGKEARDAIARKLALGGNRELRANGDASALCMGSCPRVFVVWLPGLSAEPPPPDAPRGHRDILRFSVPKQLQELQATLSLSKVDLARVMRVSRPAVYDWYGGKEPNPTNAERLHVLVRCLVRAEVSSIRPLNWRFVGHPMELDEPSLLDLLSEEQLDESRIVPAIKQSLALADEVTRDLEAREEEARRLGFEMPSREQRIRQLALNMALREWPNH